MEGPRGGRRLATTAMDPESAGRESHIASLPTHPVDSLRSVPPCSHPPPSKLSPIPPLLPRGTPARAHPGSRRNSRLLESPSPPSPLASHAPASCLRRAALAFPSATRPPGSGRSRAGHPAIARLIPRASRRRRRPFANPSRPSQTTTRSDIIPTSKRSRTTTLVSHQTLKQHLFAKDGFDQVCSSRSRAHLR